MLTLAHLFVIVAYLVGVSTSSSSKLFLKEPGYYVEDVNDEVLDLSAACAVGGKYKCIQECFERLGCRSATYVVTDTVCKIHMVSPWDLNFSGNITDNTDSTTYVKDTGSEEIQEWKTLAKFSASTGSFEGDYSYELWNNSATSVNNDSCAAGETSTRCNRHYVHSAKDSLLALSTGTKVKVSLYEDGVEAAWVIFDKQPGSNDNWFRPSRVIDSYPWDTELLKSSSQMSMEPQEYNDAVRFYIVEPNSAFYLRAMSGHAYWMKLVDSSGFPQHAECEYGRSVNYPYILYSKGTNPTRLSKSAVSHAVKWSSATDNSGRYTLPWSGAENFCENNLHVPIATYAEVDNARVNQPYQCCQRGWMAGQITSFPMLVNTAGCGGPGMAATGSSGSYNIYCQPDQSLVGVADTMVISINV